MEEKSREFGPSGEFDVQYRAPMSFCFYPTLYMCILFSLWEIWQFFKRAKYGIYLRSLSQTCYGGGTTFTCDVTIVPVVTRAPNATNTLSLKIAPEPLVCIGQRNGFPNGSHQLVWYIQSDRRKIVEPPWFVLDIEPYGLNTLHIAPKCGIMQKLRLDHYEIVWAKSRKIYK